MGRMQFETTVLDLIGLVCCTGLQATLVATLLTASHCQFRCQADMIQLCVMAYNDPRTGFILRLSYSGESAEA